MKDLSEIIISLQCRWSNDNKIASRSNDEIQLRNHDATAETLVCLINYQEQDGGIKFHHQPTITRITVGCPIVSPSPYFHLLAPLAHSLAIGDLGSSVVTVFTSLDPDHALIRFE
ncbi:hypothetical protein DKX38_005362 [Salix brachista]|uniref:Uncharacterized protein n=1 Tax=Salix brachista TaxID=2182728 RepID=A0A5N5MZD3_9ROSI|nr:hypothetical protein DKX38_005362 [Salix brachista]